MPTTTPTTPFAGKFWLLTMNTPNYTFTATGATQQDAQEVLVKAWAKHFEQAQAWAKHEEAPWEATPETTTPADIFLLDKEFDLRYQEMSLGQCWRDDLVMAQL